MKALSLMAVVAVVARPREPQEPFFGHAGAYDRAHEFVIGGIFFLALSALMTYVVLTP